MATSSMALWLNEAFAGYDGALLSAFHSLATGAGGLFTPIMKIITFLGEKGIVFFLLALIFMCFSSERSTGVCIFGAVCCGALITNIILKDSVARARPFEAAEQFRIWWEFVGSPSEDGFSFPSGHVTAAASGMTAISLMKGKKMIAPSIIIVVLMGISRNYLMAHYPSDVLFAMIIGLASGVIAWVITHLIFNFLEYKRDDMPIAELVLDFDISEVLPFELPDLSQLAFPNIISLFDRSQDRGSNVRKSNKSVSYNTRHSSSSTARAGSHTKPVAATERTRKTVKLPNAGGYVGKHEKK